MLTCAAQIAMADANPARSLLIGPEKNCAVPEWTEGRNRFDKDVRNQTWLRSRAMCEYVGAHPDTCEFVEAVGNRESRHRLCSVHVKGHDEFGLGPHGLDLFYHWDKWSGRRWYPRMGWEVAKEFYVPEVSTIVVLRIVNRAIYMHHAKNWVEVNSVFATGRVRVREEKDAAFCRHLSRWKLDCLSPPTFAGGTKIVGYKQTKAQFDAVLTVQGSFDFSRHTASVSVRAGEAAGSPLQDGESKTLQ